MQEGKVTRMCEAYSRGKFSFEELTKKLADFEFKPVSWRNEGPTEPTARMAWVDEHISTIEPDTFGELTWCVAKGYITAAQRRTIRDAIAEKRTGGK